MQNEVFRKLLGSYPSKAIKLLYDRYYHALKRVAFKYTGDIAAAEDAVQETFSVVWENHKQLSNHHESSIQYYLIKVVKLKSILFYRQTRNNQKKERGLRDRMSLAVDHTIEHKIIESECSAQLHQIIQTLPLKERECLVLKLDEGLAAAEIAMRLNLSPKVVEHRLSSARKRLREIYTQVNK